MHPPDPGDPPVGRIARGRHCRCPARWESGKVASWRDRGSSRGRRDETPDGSRPSAWEAAFPDPNESWTLNLQYEWAPLGRASGLFILDSQGGTPHRIISGTIIFDNTGSTPFFADPTPWNNSAYTTMNTKTMDYNGQTYTTGRYLTGPIGDAVGRFDLLSIAAHEIGHGLGLDVNNTGNNTFPLIVTPPRPFAGLEILTLGASHLLYADSLMFYAQEPGIRYLISGVDVLAEAQISQFDQPNLDPYSVPEPASIILLLIGMTGLVWVTPQPSRPGRGHDRPRCRGGGPIAVP